MATRERGLTSQGMQSFCSHEVSLSLGETNSKVCDRVGDGPSCCDEHSGRLAPARWLKNGNYARHRHRLSTIRVFPGGKKSMFGCGYRL